MSSASPAPGTADSEAAALDPLAGAARARPSGLGEATEALRAGGRVLIHGGGTGLDWGAPPEAVDTVLETAGLDRVLRYDADDGVAIVEGGAPLAALDACAVEHGRRTALDATGSGRPTAPRLALDAVPDGATVGGLVARAFDGPQRLRYGAVRDLVIGVTLALADGSVVRAGGTVIKNVAGYDLMRLATGSIGTLGLIARVAVRLQPVPRATATLEVAADAATAEQVALELLDSALEPAAVDWTGPPAGAGTLRVQFVGVPEAVDGQVAAVTERLAARRLTPRRLSGADEEGAWATVAGGHAGVPGETVVRAATLPDRLSQVARAATEAAAEAGVTTSLSSHAALGLHDARVTEGDGADHAAFARGWRRRIARLGGHATVRRRAEGLADPHGVWVAEAVWGPEPPGFSLMRDVKRALDPERRLAPGRFVGGL